MSALRQRTCRTSSLTTLLLGLNITTLIVLWPTGGQVQQTLWSDSNPLYRQVGRFGHWPAISTTTALTEVTATVTAMTTTTVHVEPSPLPSSPSKPPGPTFCDTCGEDDQLCTLYGEHNLARSRAYEGANARFRRVISNALAGKPTKIGILGGSVTKGHGLRNGNVENWINIFHKAWRELFPKSETTLINGAVPATGSDYLSMCFREHIDEDVDLVIVELLINDQRAEFNSIAYEWLLRGLLELPSNPAVVNLHTIGLSFELITTGGDLHLPIAEYYDSPTISVRNMLAPHILKNAHLDEHYFTLMDDGTPDWRHVNYRGHKVMGDVLVAYTQRQICAVEKEKAHPTKYTTDGTLAGTDALETIPRLRLFQKYDRESVTKPNTPTCQSIRTSKHPLSPTHNTGWTEWTHHLYKDKPYLIAKIPGSIVKFDVVVGLLGRVRVTYLRSRTFGLGDAWCWLDDDRKSGIRVVSWWELEINSAAVSTITGSAPPGKHILTCEVMQETSDPAGGHEFRLIAVDAA